jgi:hypothetical protein
MPSVLLCAIMVVSDGNDFGSIDISVNSLSSAIVLHDPGSWDRGKFLIIIKSKRPNQKRHLSSSR